MLFLSIADSEHDFSAASRFLTYGVIANILFFIVATFSVRTIFAGSNDKGVIIQGCYRSNTAIIAIAYVANAYGSPGVTMAALYVAVTTLLYNVLAVICLAPNGGDSGEKVGKIMFTTLTKNPLILSILAGLMFYLLAVPVPDIAVDAGNYLAKMTLPLALLCTGGSLDLSSMRQESQPSWFATSYKLVLAPALIVGGAIWFGLSGMELGILFFMNAAPVAAASYVMARAMGHNASLAANIIAMSTVLSTFTCTFGVIVLLSLGLI
jgi:predicted permease